MAVASDEVEPHEKADDEGNRPSIQLRLLLLSEVEPDSAAAVRGLERVATQDEALLVLGKTAYDVVAVDVTSPDGAVRLEALRRRAPNAGLIALTPPGEPARMFEALRAGAQECLPAAPLDALELERVARTALDRRWLSEFLEKQVTFLLGVFQCVSPGVAVLDPEGKLVLANRAWQALAERADDALAGVLAPGSSMLEALEAGESSAHELASGIQVVLEGRLASVRTELLRKLDGEERWFLVQVDAMPERAGAVVMQADITERKHAEDALRRSEVDYRKLLEDLPQGVAVHRDGVCLWVNRAALGMLGFERAEQVVGRKIASAVPREDLAHLDAARPGASAKNQPRDVRVTRADGSTALLEIRALEVVYDGLPATLLLGTDVGEHRALTARAMEMDRVSSAGLLATALGHEIKNPLAFVSANVDIALRDAQESLTLLDGYSAGAFDTRVLRDHLREIRGALQDARQGTRRVEAVVGDLKAFSRPEQTRDGPVDIEAVLNSAINITRNEIRHRARLVRNYFPAPAVRGSEAQLGQVFLNLLTNAADAIAVGDAAHNQIAVGLHAKDGRVIVEISDTGGGIAPADLPRVFDPFFTKKPVGEGTGMGLAICRNIVEGVGGAISVKSEVGRGTTVRVELLEAESQRPPAPMSTISPLKPISQVLRVLVVDDEPLIGRAVARCLGRQHQVRWVASGREALQFLATEPFDVVFLDVMMPDMTGVEVYQRVSQTLPDMVPRIVFLTGGAFTADAREFLEAVPNPQLGKPFDSQQIRQVALEIASAASVRQVSSR